jgi:hypothetical protein
MIRDAQPLVGMQESFIPLRRLQSESMYKEDLHTLVRRATPLRLACHSCILVRGIVTWLAVGLMLILAICMLFGIKITVYHCLDRVDQVSIA